MPVCWKHCARLLYRLEGNIFEENIIIWSEKKKKTIILKIFLRANLLKCRNIEFYVGNLIREIVRENRRIINRREKIEIKTVNNRSSHFIFSLVRSFKSN